MVDLYLTRQGAADHLSAKLGRRITIGALHRHASDGTGPVYKMILGRASYREADLDAWIARLVEAPKKRPRTRNPLTHKRQSQAEAKQSAELSADVAA